MAGAVRVDGLRDLQKAFRLADKELSRELRKTLREVAEPIRSESESRAVASIPKIGFAWSRMRVGVTLNTVYVAPRKRGARGRNPQRRPNLKPLLLDRSMEPSLAANQPRVVAAVDDMLGRVGHKWEHA